MKNDDEVYCEVSRFFAGLSFIVRSSSPMLINYKAIHYPKVSESLGRDSRIFSHQTFMDIRCSTIRGIDDIMPHIEKLLEFVDTVDLKIRVSDMPGKWRKGSVREVKDKLYKLLKEG